MKLSFLIIGLVIIILIFIVVVLIFAYIQPLPQKTTSYYTYNEDTFIDFGSSATTQTGIQTSAPPTTKPGIQTSAPPTTKPGIDYNTTENINKLTNLKNDIYEYIYNNTEFNIPQSDLNPNILYGYSAYREEGGYLTIKTTINGTTSKNKFNLANIQSYYNTAIDQINAYNQNKDKELKLSY